VLSVLSRWLIQELLSKIATLSKYSRTLLNRTLVIRTVNYSDRFGSSGKFVENSYSLTPRCTVLPEQINGLQLVRKFPAISRNPKVHYRIHKRPPPVSILGQPNPVHIPTSHLLQIHPNIIHPSTPRSPQWSPSLQFTHQDPIHHPLLTPTRHMSNPSHSSPFYHPHNIG